jgi:anti-anti-sigma factor
VTSHAGGHFSLELAGDLDRWTAGALERAIRTAEASGAATITIDLHRVEFIDLGGLRAILAAHQRLKDRLRLLEAPAGVQSVFRLTGAEDWLPFDRSVPRRHSPSP